MLARMLRVAQQQLGQRPAACSLGIRQRLQQLRAGVGIVGLRLRFEDSGDGLLLDWGRVQGVIYERR